MTAQIFHKNGKLKHRLIAVIYIVLFVVCFLASLCIHGGVAEKLRHSSELEQSTEEVFDAGQLSEFNLVGCQLTDDGTYTSETDDPQMSFSLDGSKLVNVEINLKEPAEESVSWQVYYCNSTDESFSEDRVVSGVIDIGNTESELWVEQDTVTAVRIDIGSSNDQELEIENISLNDNDEEGLFENIAWRKVILWTQIYFFAIGFVILHFIAKSIKDIYEKIFRFRWIVALCFLIFFTANKLNGDSLAVYDLSIQPNLGSEYVDPVIGEDRYIRSDEFVVDSPSELASGYGDTPYSQYNYIQRGTRTLNSINGIYLGYSTIGKSPYYFIYAILDREYAYSFCWYAPIILTFMTAFELCLIISKRRKWLAFLGACLIGLSPFYLWWNFPTFLVGAQGAIVCAYYFLRSKSFKKRILCALGFSVALANYVLTLYPAWIVPMGYVCLLIVVWLLHDNWQHVKSLRLKEYLLIILAVAFAGSLILSYLRLNQEYITAIGNTVYPGHRVESGGFSIPRIFSYFQNGLFGFKDIGNSSEESSLISFFPIPLIAAIYQWVRMKKKDWFLSGMIVVSLVYILYCTTGLPTVVAQATLLSYSTPTRILPIIGIAQIFLLIRVLSIDPKERKTVPKPVAVVIGAATAVVGVLYSVLNYPDYMGVFWITVSFIIVVGASVIIMTKTNEKARRVFEVGISCVAVFIALSIRPISIGLDAIFSKPVATEIQNICSKYKDAKWIVYGNDFKTEGFVVACGASTINSTNTYPNYELWDILDPEGKYEEYYNRYAHILVNFIEGETNVELVYEDCIQLNLSYDDIEKIGCTYIFATEPLSCSEEGISFEEEYYEDGTYIYHVAYS